ncbi:MAG: hypothetical protein HXY50_03455 [Ignavibacteriaceae bacterium]|nr:hypothetical protein [Ignavibacteriaceae bacterium]
MINKYFLWLMLLSAMINPQNNPAFQSERKLTIGSVEESSMNMVHLELGLRNEVAMLFTKYWEGYFSNHIETSLPINLHITAGWSFLDRFKLDLRLGLLLVYEDFVGIDEGIFFEFDFLNSKLYGTLGAVIFNNGGNAHGVTMYSESGGSQTLLSFGLGYHISNKFDIDLKYYSPTNRVYGRDIVGFNEPQHFDKINNGLLLLGIQNSFIL